MTLIKPLFCWFHTLTATNHITVRYTDASTQSVSLSAGSYAAHPGVGGLLVQLALDLNSDATNGGTWTVSYSSTTNKIVILSSGGAKTPDRLTFLTSELTPYDLGFTPDSGSTIVDDDASTAGQFSAEWPMRRMWAPDEYLVERSIQIDTVSSTVRSRYSGRVVAEKRSQSGGVKTITYRIPFVRGPRVWGFAADSSNLYSLDSNVVQSDPNVSLDRFRERYLEGISSNTLPRAKVLYAGSSNPTTYDDVVLFVSQDSFEDISSLDRAIQEPLLGEVVILAAPWVAS